MMDHCVMMVSLFVVIALGAAETLQIKTEKVEPATLEACAAKRAAKIAELRAGADAKKYRSYQIICVQLGT